MVKPEIAIFLSGIVLKVLGPKKFFNLLFRHYNLQYNYNFQNFPPHFIFKKKKKNGQPDKHTNR